MTEIVPTSYLIYLATVLFGIGAAGVLTRRNVIVVFMSIELMLNAVNLVFVSFARHFQAAEGQAIVFLVMIVAAAEAAVGLAIFISIFRTRETLNADEMNLLKG
jgi:NADH-quinone oxidoreductase subunit K